MPEQTLPRTITKAPLVLGEWEPPHSNGHGPPFGGNGGGPGGGRRRGGGGRPGGGRDDGGDAAPINWRWVHVPLAIAAVLLLACIVANLVPVDKYVLASDRARSVEGLISPRRAHHRSGDVLLSDVSATRLSLFGYLFYGVFGHTVVLPGSAVLGPGIPPSELALEDDAETAQSVADAKVSALRSLGYTVASRDVGILVLAVEPGSPGSRHLRQGETVTAVDGIATSDTCAFARALARTRPGESIQLRVERSRVTARGAIVAGPTVTEHVRLGQRPASLPASSVVPECPHLRWPRGAGYLGLIEDTEEAFRFPVAVDVRAGGIHGASAGLAIALGIVDELSGGHLTGRRTVAAVGTLTPEGRVGEARTGEVSSVRESAYAAWAAGATLMFVPERQLTSARSTVPSSLHVVGVGSLTQAVDALRRLGGTT